MMPGVYEIFGEYAVPDIIRFLEFLEARHCSYEKGECILREGDPTEFVAIVVAGSLHSKLEMPTGESYLLRTLTVGTLAGTVLLFVPQDRHLCSLYAPEHVEVVTLSVKKALAWRMRPESRQFFRALERQIFEHNKAVSRKCVIMSQPTVEKRIMAYIGFRCHDEKTQTIKVAGTEAEFANFIGSHPVSVSRALNKLRDEGKISYTRNVDALFPRFETR